MWGKRTEHYSVLKLQLLVTLLYLAVADERRHSHRLPLSPSALVSGVSYLCLHPSKAKLIFYQSSMSATPTESLDRLCQQGKRRIRLESHIEAHPTTDHVHQNLKPISLSP